MKRICQLVFCAIVAAFVLSANAQYPAKSITIVVPFPPGATTDTIARVLGQAVSNSIGKPVVIENKPGAEGQLAAQDVAKAVPDGYKIMLATSGNMSVLPALRKNPPYDVVADFTPIADVGRYQFFLYVHPSLPAKSYKEFLDYARTNPGKISYGTGNNTGVMAMANIKSVNGLDMMHVPYKGEPPAMIDLVAGRVQAMIGTGIGIPYVKDNRLRMLVALLPKRSSVAPDVPTMRDVGQKDLDAEMWAAFFGPAGMPREAVERLNKEFNAAMANAEVQRQIEKLGFTLHPGAPETLGALVKNQLGVYRQLVRDSGLQPE